MTGDNSTKRITVLDLSLLDDTPQEKVWEILEEEMVEFYAECAGIKKENISPDARRALCAGYAFCSGQYGSIFYHDPSSFNTWMAPEILMYSANWIVEHRIKKPIGN